MSINFKFNFPSKAKIFPVIRSTVSNQKRLEEEYSCLSLGNSEDSVLWGFSSGFLGDGLDFF